MPKKRKVDELAGKDSLLDRLRKRRESVEKGDLDGAPDAFTQAEDSEAAKAKEKEELDNIRRNNQTKPASNHLYGKGK